MASVSSSSSSPAVTVTTVVSNKEPELSEAIKKHDEYLAKLRETRAHCAHCDQVLLSFEDVIYLPCLHVLCTDTCLEMNVVDDQEHGQNQHSKKARMTSESTPNLSYSCPKCHLEVDQDTVTKWRDLGTAIFYKESLLTCTQCLRMSDSLYWCAECNDSLCHICKDAHQMRKRTAKHVVTFLDPSAPNSASERDKEMVLCSQHRVESGDYCLTCTIPLCKEPDCQQRHSGHELKNTKQAIDAFRFRTLTLNEKMRGFLEEANPLLESFEAEITRELDPNSNSEVLAAFQAEFKRIIEFVAKCEMQVCQRLAASSLTKVNELKNRSIKVRSLEGQITHYLSKVGDTLGLSSQQIASNLGLLESRLDKMHDALETVTVTEDPTNPLNQIQTVDNSDSSAADSDTNSSSSTSAQIGSPPKPVLESASVAGPLQIGAYLKPLQKITRRLQDFVIAVETARDPQLVLSRRHRKIIEPAADVGLDVELDAINQEIEQEYFPHPQPTPNNRQRRSRRSKTAAAAQSQSTTDKLDNFANDDKEDEDAGAAVVVKEPEPVSRKRKAVLTPCSSNSSGQNGPGGPLMENKFNSTQPLSAGSSEDLAGRAHGTLCKSPSRSRNPSREKNGTGYAPSPYSGSENTATACGTATANLTRQTLNDDRIPPPNQQQSPAPQPQAPHSDQPPVPVVTELSLAGNSYLFQPLKYSISQNLCKLKLEDFVIEPKSFLNCIRPCTRLTSIHLIRVSLKERLYFEQTIELPALREFDLLLLDKHEPFPPSKYLSLFFFAKVNDFEFTTLANLSPDFIRIQIGQVFTSPSPRAGLVFDRHQCKYVNWGCFLTNDDNEPSTPLLPVHAQHQQQQLKYLDLNFTVIHSSSFPPNLTHLKLKGSRTVGQTFDNILSNLTNLEELTFVPQSSTVGRIKLASIPAQSLTKASLGSVEFKGGLGLCQLKALEDLGLGLGPARHSGSGGPRKNPRKSKNPRKNPRKWWLRSCEFDQEALLSLPNLLQLAKATHFKVESISKHFEWDQMLDGVLKIPSLESFELYTRVSKEAWPFLKSKLNKYPTLFANKGINTSEDDGLYGEYGAYLGFKLSKIPGDVTSWKCLDFRTISSLRHQWTDDLV